MGRQLDLFGYVTDPEVTTRAIEALDRRPGMIFAQINSPDTFAHACGPDSEEAIQSYRELDAYLATIGSAIRWDQDLVLVTSDHDQETVDPTKRIDLHTVADETGIDVTVVDEGTAAMITGAGGFTADMGRKSPRSGELGPDCTWRRICVLSPRVVVRRS